MEMKKQAKEKLTGVILFALSLVYLLSCWKLKIGTVKNPGPGFIPVVIGILLLICTAAYLIRVFAARPGEKAAPQEIAGEKNYRAVVGIIAGTVIYPFILEPLKFIAATTALAFAMLLLLKPKKPVFSFLLALSLAVGCFLIFSRLLGMVLPSGFMEDFLFQVGG
jgi:putative tricarboxylic transport membrane protein